MASTACRVCGDLVAYAFTAHERMSGNREAFDYLECRSCGCLQIDVIPEPLERHYPPDYYTTRQRSRRRFALPKPLRGLARRSTRLRIGLARSPHLALGRRYGGCAWFALTQTDPRDPILDVGCGSGRLLDRLHGLGFERLTGIDPALGGQRRAARGALLLRRALEDHAGRYRLVMAHHSFEHLRDPRRAFDAFARLVEPGGWLLLRLPRADGEARRHYGADWVQLDAPRHLHLHTRASLEWLAARTGFRLERVEDDSGPFQVWGSELYRRDIALARAGRGGAAIFGWRERLAFRRRARAWRRAGIGDQACFYLRRDPDAAPGTLCSPLRRQQAAGDAAASGAGRRASRGASLASPAAT